MLQTAHPDLIFCPPIYRPGKSNPLPAHQTPSAMLLLNVADK